jgi:nicotinamidase-related amidase
MRAGQPSLASRASAAASQSLGPDRASCSRSSSVKRSQSRASYRGFFDNGHRKATGLGELLQNLEVTRVYVMGLATDYCVKFTALDARRLGLETILIADGCRAVNLGPSDGERAVAEMREAGVAIVESNSLAPGR